MGRDGRLPLYPDDQPLSVWEGLAVLLALIAAFYFRFVHIEATWMSSDQSTLLSMAMDIGRGVRFPLVANQSSAGLVHPALPVYLYAIPLALTHQVVSAAGLTAFLNTLSVGIGYLYARRFLGRLAGLTFLALYAVSPWSVHFSRLIWNPVMIPFFAALALWLLTASIAGKARLAVFIGTALTLIGIFQSHLASLPLLVSIGTIWLLFHRQVRFWSVALGVSLVGLSFVPYLLNQPDLPGLFSRIAAAQETNVNVAPMLIAGDLVSGRGLFLAAGGWKTAENLLRVWLWVSLAWLGFFTVRSARKAWHGSLALPDASRVVLFLWITIPLLLLMRHHHYLQHHYFLFLYPLVYLAMAALIEDLGSFLHRFVAPRWPLKMQRIRPFAGTPGLLFLLTAVFGWSLFVSNAVLRQEEAQTCPQARHICAAVDTIRAYVNSFHFGDLVVLSDGIDASYSTFGFIGQLFPENISVRFTRLGNGLPVPSSPALYLVAGEDSRTTAVLDRIGRPLNIWDIGPCGTWRLYATSGHPSLEDGIPEPIAEWANGLQLWNYQVEKAVRGEGLILTTFWRVTNERPLYWDYFFFHLFSSSGQFISQMDGPGVSSPYWREGDWLILLTTLPIPADAPTGPYEIYCGLYSWPSLERIPITRGEATDNRLRLMEMQIP
ncbi:MAG: hypothetical protein ACP5N6_15905 [Anaerolineae bacterium]